MTQFKILGIGSTKDKLLKANLLEAITRLEIVATVLEITKIDEILSHKVDAIPALYIGEKIIYQGQVPSAEELTKQFKKKEFIHFFSTSL